MFHCKRRGRAAKREERGRKISPPLHNFTFSLASRGFTHRKLWLSVVDKAYRRVEQAREARARQMDTCLCLAHFGQILSHETQRIVHIELQVLSQQKSREGFAHD